MFPEVKLFSCICLSNLMRLKFPYKLSFAVTYHCNLRCQMCGIWSKPRSPELTVEEIEGFLRKSNKFSWVGLTGGEVFLREDIVDITRIVLKYCRDLCILHFPTNGYLKDRITARVHEMLKLNPPRLFVTVSVDGPARVHDKMRGVVGSWKNAVETFLSLKGIPGVNPYLSMTLCQDNLGVIDETIDSIKEIYPSFDANKMMNFNFFQKSTHYFENAGLESPDKELLLKDLRRAADIVGQGVTFKNYLQKNFLKFSEAYLKTGKSPLPCQVLSASLFMNPYGDLFPCGVYDKKFGNIKDPGFKFEKLWNDPLVRNLHKACKKGSCPGCWTPCDAYQSINGSLAKICGVGATSAQIDRKNT